MASRKPHTPGTARPARPAPRPPDAAEASPSDLGAPEYYAKDRKPPVAKPQTRH